MIYRVLADLVVVVHFAFVLFVVGGVLLVLRWPHLAWAHLPAVAWGAWIELAGRICPLTPLEVRWRRLAGQAGYEGGFIEQYLLGVLYPAGLTRGVQVALGVAVLVVNLVVYWLVWRKWNRARQGGR